VTVDPIMPMRPRPGSADELARLTRERAEADRLYGDALTALDGAIRKLRDLPHPPPPPDELQITPLNERWELLPLGPTEGSGWLARVRAQVWAMVAPLFERQQAFNSALVDHINRNVSPQRETARAIASTLSVFREELESLIHFQTRLILYAQQITPYVDTKDREVAGLMHGLAAGLSGLGDELQKRWESMVARERRYEAQVNEVRGTLSVVQRATQSLKRELEERRRTEPPASSQPHQAPGLPPASASLDSYKYVGFEDQFRGSQSEIRERVSIYVSAFEGAADVLDIGCGRGEFLDLLRERGISARGVDLNDEMAAVCRARGLDATAGDALGYLLALPDGSLGGLFAAQVVEHLEPDYLMRLLDAAYHKLRPGSTIILETINAACWYAFFASYIRDLTHVRPLHPDTLRYLVLASGFQRVEIRYTAPFPDDSKLQPVPVQPRDGAANLTPETVAILNENARKLNDLLFTHLDYAAIGVRL
jgi:O-antigen chain-terminating methyltransferase